MFFGIGNGIASQNAWLSDTLFHNRKVPILLPAFIAIDCCRHRLTIPRHPCIFNRVPPLILSDLVFLLSVKEKIRYDFIFMPVSRLVYNKYDICDGSLYNFELLLIISGLRLFATLVIMILNTNLVVRIVLSYLSNGINSI